MQEPAKIWENSCSVHEKNQKLEVLMNQTIGAWVMTENSQ